METVKLMHVHHVRVRGRDYWYHRVTRERLPDTASARAIKVLAINAALEDDTPKRETAEPGTIADLIQRYRAAPAYRKLAMTTQRDYLRYLDHLAQTYGDLPVEQIDRPFVLALRDTFSATPRAADYMIAVLRRTMSYAVDMGLRADNPALRPGRLAVGEAHKEWPEVALGRFRAKAPQRLVWAVEIALYTGQRQGDVLAMQWQHYRGGMIHVVQGKTGARLAIPVHRDLAGVLDGIPRDHMMILTTSHGRAWAPGGFRSSFHKAVLRCELSGLTFHGLRHTAGARLAEAGCSDRQIMAILGHKTAMMVTRYTAQADQQRLAKAAILKLEKRNED